MGLLDKAGNIAGSAADGKTDNNVAEPELLPIAPDLESVVFNELENNVENVVVFNDVEEQLAFFHRVHFDFDCLVLDGSAEGDFCEAVSAIIDKTGTVIPLPQGFPLILLPPVLDRELIAHRLSGTLSAKILLSFRADSPDSALEQLGTLP